MDLGIKGKNALVMAGSRGLGLAAAVELIKEGVNVAICARDKEHLDATAKEIGAMAFQADLSVPGAAEKLVAGVQAKLGNIDILFINNGGPPQTKFENTSDQQWRDTFESLFMTSVDAIRACLPGMQEKHWGRIVVITSVGAKEPLPSLIMSNSIRSGVHGLVNSVSKEYAKDGITINAVMPGFTMTRRMAETLKKMNISEDQKAATIPAGRVGQPHETAGLMAFLASERAGYITGQAIACDGAMMHSI
jgi:3-oxoacyl-[acyl-carrier protein] reductase